MFKKTLISLAVASSVGLTGCFDSGSTGANANPDYQISNPDFTGKTWPIFNPITSEIPVPSDLNFDQEAQDGSFAVSGDMNNPVIGALNNLSGASTVAPAVLRFNGDINPDSVDSRAFIPNPAFVSPTETPTQLPAIPNPNQNVFLIELTYASGEPVRALSAGEPPTIPLAITFQVAAGLDPLGSGTDLSARNQAAAAGYLAELAASPTYDHDVVELNGDSAIRVRPNKPLNPLSRYIVVVTDGVTDLNGDAIVGSPSYQSLGDEEQPLGNPALAPVKTLITGFWENISTNYFALNNSSRAGAGLPALNAEDIALSYSFTTSEDKKVLSHIANPANWISDQLERQVKVGAAGLRAAAAAVFSAQATGEESGLDPERFGLPETATDAEVQAAVVTALGKDPATEVVEVTDFLRPGNTDPTSFGFGDVSFYVGDAVDNFTPSEALGDANFTPCDALEDKAKFNCVGATAEAGFGLAGIEFPTASVRDIDLGSGPADALSVSAVLSSLDIGPGEVSVHQGFIELPQYIAVPDSTETGITSSIRTQSWRPDVGLAAVVGNQLDATIPQEDSDVSDVLNYNWPFPDLQGEVQVPMLVITPAGADPTVGGSDLIPVIFQHGITTDRSAALAFGSQLVAAAQNLPQPLNLAVFAIDQPLHGVAPFTAEQQLELAETLIEAAVVDALLPMGIEDIDELPEESAQQIRSQAMSVAETLAPAAVAALDTADPLASFTTQVEAVEASLEAPGLITGDPTYPATATVLLRTVENAGSTIPGLTPASTETGVVAGVNERHYGFTAGSDGNPIAMDFEDGVGSSGSLFINLTNFMNSRDILRQGSVDLMNLTATLNSSPELPGLTNNGVLFIGHSLGTLNGGAFVGAALNSGESDLMVAGAHLLTPVAGTTRLLENSPSFAPTILGGLQAAAGLTQGDADLETFLNVNQAMLDSVDPINFAHELAVSNTVLAQVDGDRTTPNAADTRYGEDNGPLNITFPNGLTVDSPAAPLSGSEALAAIMGAEGITPADTLADIPAITRYPFGVHSTPVLPQEEIAEQGDVLQNRTIAVGGEVIVSAEDAEAAFGAMIQKTLELLGQLNGPT